MNQFLAVYRTKVMLPKSSFDSDYNKGMRLFVDALQKMGMNKASDANSTMRFTYGNVLPYDPADAVHYDFFTTLEGVMQKEVVTDDKNHEFYVPQKLKDLYEAKDYGPYARKEDGKLPVGFLSNNDITGGNSGSPVINAYGELIGTAFDGNWEAMSGDIYFEPNIQRTISVDIRYILFIVDKYANAGYLIDEMTIAPSRKNIVDIRFQHIEIAENFLDLYKESSYKCSKLSDFKAHNLSLLFAYYMLNVCYMITAKLHHSLFQDHNHTVTEMSILHAFYGLICWIIFVTTIVGLIETLDIINRKIKNIA